MATFERDDTYNKVVDIVVEKLGLDKNVIKLTTTFQDLGADSVDMVEMIMRIEEYFNIEINDEDAEKMQTMDDVVTYIHERRTR